MSTIFERSLYRFLTTLTTVVIGLALSVPNVLADAGYERAEPPADAVVPVAPSTVHVWFTQELFRREGDNALEVLASDGTRVDLQDVQMDDDDRTHLFVTLEGNLPGDVYTVRWRTLSADDGHPSEGEFAFTVDPETPAIDAETIVTSTTIMTSEIIPSPAPTSTSVPTAPSTIAHATATPVPQAQFPGGLPCLGSAALGIGSISLVFTRRSRFLERR